MAWNKYFQPSEFCMLNATVTGLRRHTAVPARGTIAL
jgi:hypothetical protein